MTKEIPITNIQAPEQIQLPISKRHWELGGIQEPMDRWCAEGLLMDAAGDTILAMTQLLERAFNEAAKLPEKEQDAVATVLLQELASEHRWDEAFGSSQHQLSEMARAALREFEAGETQPMDPERDFTDQ